MSVWFSLRPSRSDFNYLLCTYVSRLPLNCGDICNSMCSQIQVCCNQNGIFCHQSQHSIEFKITIKDSLGNNTVLGYFTISWQISQLINLYFRQVDLCLFVAGNINCGKFGDDKKP